MFGNWLVTAKVRGLCNTAIYSCVCPSVCLSHALSTKMVHFRENTNRKPHSGSRSGENGNEAVAGASSEAFTSWLHH